MGDRPTHPLLLDWLAAEFVASGWKQKALHRLIVTSATYRQSSKARPDAAAVDPDNRLLARQSRLRLDAEIIRDTALVASGLFAPKIGGPERLPAPAGRRLPGHPGAPGVENLNWGRPLPPRHVHLLSAVCAASGPDRFRCAGLNGDLHAARPVEHSLAGFDDVE